MKKSNKFCIVVIIILIILSASLLTYILYDKGLFDKYISENQKEDSQEQDTVETQAEETYSYNIEDDLIQQLYSYVRSYGVFDQQLIYLVQENNEILISDIDSEILNYFGYRQLRAYQIKSDLCSNYPLVVNNDYYICNWGESVDVGENAMYNSTLVFSEDDLQNEVEKIFGNNSYQTTDEIEVGFATYYIYDSSSKNYVHATIPGGGTSLTYSKELIDVKMEDNDIILEELITAEDQDDLTIYYTFKEDSEGNYYLYYLQGE